MYVYAEEAAVKKIDGVAQKNIEKFRIVDHFFLATSIILFE